MKDGAQVRSHPNLILKGLLTFDTFRGSFLARLQLVNALKFHTFGQTPLLEAQWNKWKTEIEHKGGIENNTIEQILGSLCYYLCAVPTVSALDIDDLSKCDIKTKSIQSTIMDFRSQYFAIDFCMSQYRQAAASKEILASIIVGFNFIQRLCHTYFREPERARDVIREFWPLPPDKTLWDSLVDHH
jgi:hypothetical protein